MVKLRFAQGESDLTPGASSLRYHYSNARGYGYPTYPAYPAYPILPYGGGLVGHHETHK